MKRAVGATNIPFPAMPLSLAVDRVVSAKGATSI
jgi:hypothetical protein